jgi:catechol 2,3-dioxygenase-like lactoylglutathione lyase family enzyme
MLDHVIIGVADLERSKAFYDGALEPLGYKRAMEYPGGVGYASPTGAWDFWLRVSESVAPIHVAFHCDERGPVDAFHAAALAAGGSDNGGPGLRPHYHENYYGAFVLDPDGHNIEAVCHEPE